MSVFVDFDSVIADWIFTVSWVTDISYPKADVFPTDWIWEAYPERHSDFIKIMREESFWENIFPYPWSQKLIDVIDKSTFGNWAFCTKATKDKNSFSGKYAWLKKHFPQHEDKIWICRGNKWRLCSGSKDILVDDREDENIIPWRKAGGIGYVWPGFNRYINIEQVEKEMLNLKKVIAQNG